MTKRLASPVAVTGVGCTPFGNLRTREEIAGLTLQELAANAAKEALEDSGIRGPDVDAVYVGNVMSHSSQIPATYSQLAKWIGTQHSSGVHIDAACATTATGVGMAAQAIASGTIDTALVIGVEATGNRPKGLSPYEREDIDNETMWLWTDYCVNQAYGEPQGYEIFSTYNGIIAQGYMRKYGLTFEEYDKSMFELSRTRRLHGSLTDRAMIRETLEDEATRLGFPDAWTMWTSEVNPFLSWPARLRSLVKAADGASAVVLMREDAAKGLPSQPIRLKGFGQAVSDLPWYHEDPTDWGVDRVAIKRAYEMAGVGPSDLDYLHTHDCSHIMSIVMAEEMGYLNPGEGLKAAYEGRTRFDGDRPMATHGGRHAFGHAWAASSGSDIHEIVTQMRGLAGARQVPKPPETAALMVQGYAIVSDVLIFQGS
jgi:acetyl-CoA C-acetyltransferase